MGESRRCDRGHLQNPDEQSKGDDCPVCSGSAAETKTHLGPTPSPDSTIDHPGRVARAESSETLPSVPGYELQSYLKRGGMGKVFLAKQPGLNRLVALKMPLHLKNEDEHKRFQREAEAAAQLRHPNICTIFQVGESGGMPFIAMEYIRGETLQEWRRRCNPTARQCADMAAALARGVEHAHRHGIVHRDIKPANVMVHQDPPQPVLMDFGLAKAQRIEEPVSPVESGDDSELTVAGQVMGTPAYMAPEQAEGRTSKIGPSADIYALGAVLYELLAGRPPYRGSAGEVLAQVRSLPPTPLRQIHAAIHRDIETICAKAMARDPADRYVSAMAFAEDLERFSAGDAILARPENAWSRVRRAVRRNRFAAILGIALAVLGVGAAGLLHLSGKLARIQQIEESLRDEWAAGRWTDTSLQSHASLIDELATLDSVKAVQARSRFRQAIFDGGIRRLQDQVQPEDQAYVLRLATFLEASDSELAGRLRRTLENRRRDWHDLFAASGPTAASLPWKSNSTQSQATLTDPPCVGAVKMEATWESWDDLTQAGLLLRADPNDEKVGYRFVVEPVVAADASPQQPRTLGAARGRQGECNVQIYRNGIRLARSTIALAAFDKEPLHLEATAIGDRLTFQVGTQPPLVFVDVFPLRSAGRFGAISSPWLRFSEVRARKQMLPPEPQPLEQGDALYEQGRFGEALAFYEKQAGVLLGKESGQEARFKEGMALLSLKHHDEAAQRFRALAGEQGSRWPFLAACRLWMHHLQQKNLAQADDVLDAMLLGRPFERAESLTLLMPDELRDEILSQYRRGAGGAGHLRHDPNRTRNIKRMVQVEELLEVPIGSHGWSLLAWIRACRQDGDLQQASRIAENWLAKLPADSNVGVRLTAEYGWIMRERGMPSRAIPEIERRLWSMPGVVRPGSALLLVELARMHAVEGNWDESERDLERYFAEATGGDREYRFVSEACLLQGFLRERRGDAAGAMESWRRGLFERDLGVGDHRGHTQGGVGLANALALRGLCKAWNETYVEQFARSFLRELPGAELTLLLVDAKSLYRTAVAVENRMWHLPRHKDRLRQMAMQSCSFNDFVRFPVEGFVAEWIREEALGDRAEPEQEKLADEVAEIGFRALLEGKLGARQALQFGILWHKGPSSFAGIQEVKSLDPSFRGPAAYFLALRFGRLGLPAESPLRIAAELAPANSTLDRLVKRKQQSP